MVTSLVLFSIYDILMYMDNIEITCNYCDTPVKIKRDKIYMMCHCCDERRIMSLQEYIDTNSEGEYLYSMVDDNFVFNEEK